MVRGFAGLSFQPALIKCKSDKHKNKLNPSLATVIYGFTVNVQQSCHSFCHHYIQQSSYSFNFSFCNYCDLKI